jgi:hypothetical protein
MAETVFTLNTGEKIPALGLGKSLPGIGVNASDLNLLRNMAVKTRRSRKGRGICYFDWIPTHRCSL